MTLLILGILLGALLASRPARVGGGNLHGGGGYSPLPPPPKARKPSPAVDEDGSDGPL